MSIPVSRFKRNQNNLTDYLYQKIKSEQKVREKEDDETELNTRSF